LDQIEHLYDQAIELGVVDPVIVLRRANTLVPDPNAPLQIAHLARSDVVRILADGFPDAAAQVATPDPTWPMTVIIHDEVMTVYQCLPSGFADPSHRDILRICLEAAEMDWQKASERGDPDPVIPVMSMGSAETGKARIGAGIQERTSLIARFKAVSPLAVAALMSPPPPDAPMTIVIDTASGISVVHRPAP
jgi:hypothetical protein